MSKFGWDDDTPQNQISKPENKPTKVEEKNETKPINIAEIISVPKEAINDAFGILEKKEDSEVKIDNVEQSIEHLSSSFLNILSTNRVSREDRKQLLDSFPKMSLESAEMYTNVPSSAQAENTMNEVIKELGHQQRHLLNLSKQTILDSIFKTISPENPTKEATIAKLNDNITIANSLSHSMSTSISFYHGKLQQLNRVLRENRSQLITEIQNNASDEFFEEEKQKTLAPLNRLLDRVDRAAGYIALLDFITQNFHPEDLEHKSLAEYVTHLVQNEPNNIFNYFGDFILSNRNDSSFVNLEDEFISSEFNRSGFNYNNMFNDELDKVGHALTEIVNLLIGNEEDRITKAKAILCKIPQHPVQEGRYSFRDLASNNITNTLKYSDFANYKHVCFLGSEAFYYKLTRVEAMMKQGSIKMISLVEGLDVYLDWYESVLGKAIDELTVNKAHTPETIQLLTTVTNIAKTTMLDMGNRAVNLALLYTLMIQYYPAIKCSLGVIFGYMKLFSVPNTSLELSDKVKATVAEMAVIAGKLEHNFCQ